MDSSRALGTAFHDGWFVVIRHMPAPDLEQIPTELRSEADRLLALTRAHFPAHDLDGYGDVEDFFEEAYRLDAALASFTPELVWIVNGSTFKTARHVTTGEQVPPTAVDHLPRYGMQHSRDVWFITHLPERMAGRYDRLSAFVANAGRELLSAGVFDDPSVGTHLNHGIADMANRHGGEVMAKVMPRAKFLPLAHMRFDLPVTDRAARDAVTEHLEWAPVHFDGDVDAFLLQQVVTMRYEYRIFVVDHQVVTGAGSIEEHTPLNNTASFDPQLREHRDARSPVIVDEAIRDTLVAFAAGVAADIAAEQPDLCDYVIDVALGADDRPLVIELNGYLNAGLFASQPRLVTKALVAARARDSR